MGGASCVQVVRDKAVVKPAPGTRKCKCKNKLVTRQLGPGMFQQYHQQVRAPGRQGKRAEKGAAGAVVRRGSRAVVP